MDVNTKPHLSELMLICETDMESAAVLQRVATRLGCDHVEVDGPNELQALLAMRQPTLAVLAVDGSEADGLKLLQILSEHEIRPATILVGNQDARVLAGVQRIAAARGVPVIAARRRPLTEADVEQLLLEQVIAPLPIKKAELEQAIAEHEFFVLYQPKVSLEADMPIIGTEALVRWRHPTRGMLLPRHFLAAVEEHGLLTPLTDIIITEAIRQTGVWNSRGLHLQVAINLSLRLVKDRAFPDRLAALLREQELAPAQVMLDVTETAGTHDRDLILDVFTRLRVLGLDLSLDNFGTGLSSLSELYRMPFSEIKIDGLMLEDATHDRDAQSVVRAVVELAHNLGLKVCAEGVATAQTLEFIRSAGFDSAQGRLFSEPVAPAQVEEILAEMATSPQPGTGIWRTLRDRSRRGQVNGDATLAAVS